MQELGTWDATTEYRASYVSSSRVLNKKNRPYEEAVARKMQETTKSSPSIPSDVKDEDPYEAIVRKKVTNENHSAEEEVIQQPAVNSDANAIETETEDQNENAHTETTERVKKQKPVKKQTKKVFKSSYDASRLNRKRNQNTVKSTENVPLEPKIFRNPDHATAEEKKHLYGPFYVAWPKNKQMPLGYEELAKVYGRRYQ